MKKENPFKNFKGNPKFYELLWKIAQLHENKAHDYGSLHDPLANLRLAEMSGLEPWKGVIIRLGDKYSRLCEFAKKGVLKVKDESVLDTFMDNAVYSLLGAALYMEKDK